MTTLHALVVGEALVDIVQRPDGSSEEIPGGSPANVALTLGRLGRPVELVTWLGADERGEKVAEHLRDSQVFLGSASCMAPATSTAVATIGQDGAATYQFNLDWQVPATELDPATIVVHSGSIAATVEPGGSQVAELLRRARTQATITYDPNARPTIMGDAQVALRRVEEIVAAADVVKVSDEDVEWLTGGADVDEVALKWVEGGCPLVVVTCGPRGASAFFPGGRVDVRSPEVDVVDTVGAGDSFMGGLIDALWAEGLLGADRRQALSEISRDQVQRVVDRATAVSAVTVSRAGANPPWSSELEA
ncbi:MAG: carbohydrate kinase [Actinomycetaceae bacterium]|nr:carbohydrate kinase [Actinomycetaceae bacterium]